MARTVTSKLRADVSRPPIAPDQLAAVFFGGTLGALSRAMLSDVFPPGRGWPWATFTANMLGAAALAWFTARLVSGPPNRRLLQPFLCTGLCGALTTFSALQVEVIELARSGRMVLGASYLMVSIALGLLVVAIVSRAARQRLSQA